MEARFSAATPTRERTIELADDREPADLASVVADELIDDTVELVTQEDVVVHTAVRPLWRVIRNLVDNAVRHAEGRVVVTVRGEADRALLIVEDDGPGVPAGREDDIFERFTRLDTSRNRTAGGFGLGLALVASTVTAHGGTVNVDRSALGGARFTVDLPR